MLDRLNPVRAFTPGNLTMCCCMHSFRARRLIKVQTKKKPASAGRRYDKITKKKQKGLAHAKHPHVANPRSNRLPIKPTGEKKPACAGLCTTSMDGFHHPLPKKPRSSSTCEAIFGRTDASGGWIVALDIKPVQANLDGFGIFGMRQHFGAGCRISDCSDGLTVFDCSGVCGK